MNRRHGAPHRPSLESPTVADDAVDDASVDDASPGAAAARPASLWPKEHGAYGILAVPMLVALAVGGTSWVAWAIATSAIAAFLSHESLMIATLRRGHRVRQATPRAIPTGVAGAAIVLVAGLAAFAGGSSAVRVALAICLAVASVGLWLSVSGYQRSLVAQLAAMIGLTLPSATVVLVGTGSTIAALSFLGAWVVGRTATTTAVRATILASRKNPPLAARIVHDGLLTGVTTAGAIAAVRFGGVWFAALPLLAAAWGLRIVCPGPKRLKQVGWSILAINLVAGAIAVLSIGR